MHTSRALECLQCNPCLPLRKSTQTRSSSYFHCLFLGGLSDLPSSFLFLLHTHTQRRMHKRTERERGEKDVQRKKQRKLISFLFFSFFCIPVVCKVVNDHFNTSQTITDSLKLWENVWEKKRKKKYREIARLRVWWTYVLCIGLYPFVKPRVCTSVYKILYFYAYVQSYKQLHTEGQQS